MTNSQKSGTNLDIDRPLSKGPSHVSAYGPGIPEITPKDFIQQPKTIIRLKQLQAVIGLKRSTIYSKLDCNSKYFDPSFPRPIHLGKIGTSVGWLAQEVDEYIQSRITASRSGVRAKSERQILNTPESAA